MPAELVHAMIKDFVSIIEIHVGIRMSGFNSLTTKICF
jgi:hypothetical protein